MQPFGANLAFKVAAPEPLLISHAHAPVVARTIPIVRFNTSGVPFSTQVIAAAPVVSAVALIVSQRSQWKTKA